MGPEYWFLWDRPPVPWNWSHALRPGPMECCTYGPVAAGHEIFNKQAGAELCQAQDKLGLANPALPSKKLRSSPFIKFEVIFQLEIK